MVFIIMKQVIPLQEKKFQQLFIIKREKAE